MMPAQMIPKRPVLRWHGGKWTLAPWIIGYFPPHRTYTEAFGGAGSVLLRKPRCYAEVYNDLDGEVVNLFRVLQGNNSAELVRLLLLTPFSRSEFELSSEPSVDPVERARRLVIRSFMGFGSNAHNPKIVTGFRANSNRSGTTPAHDWSNYPDSLRTTIERLRGVVIENRQAVEVLHQHDGPDTLHYVDPPYPMESRTDGHGDYSHEMSQSDHEELATRLKTLRGMVVVSGYHCPLNDFLYRGWHCVEKNALADGARKRVEVLWLNPASSSKQGNLW